MTSAGPSGKVRFSIDRGGTFTDVYAELPDGGHRVVKLLSEDPSNYKDAPTEGIRRVLENWTGQPLPRTQVVPTKHIEYIRMGTTVATNALLERNGANVALVITKGFRDLLRIGNQSRPEIFDLRITKPDLLYRHVIEIDERVTIHAASPAPADAVTGITGDKVAVRAAPDLAVVRQQLQHARAQGINSVAIVLLHAYTYSKHEEMVAEVARDLGFAQVTLSSALTSSMIRVVPRGLTAAVDAYLTPLIHQYIDSFRAGFQDALSGVNLTFMQSDGGLSDVADFKGSSAVLSGPAGGLVGYAMTSFDETLRKPVIGFDMGGTSTDVSRYAGVLEHVMETELAGVTIQAPQLDINTVAAGGGSRLFFRSLANTLPGSGKLEVGPESARAHPGPVCYRKGGHLAVTDANVVLGRIMPSQFPKIFGPNEDEPLDVEGARAAFARLGEEINAARGADHPPLSVEEIASGFLAVANEAMARPIRNLTEARGYDVAAHVLACFGGAGPQHACSVARVLGMHEIFIHRFGGILSAYGIGLADVVKEQQEACSLALADPSALQYIRSRVAVLTAAAYDRLAAAGFAEDRISSQVYLHLRYDGTDSALMTRVDVAAQDASSAVFLQQFVTEYRREFGFELQRGVLIDDIRVRAVGSSHALKRPRISPQIGDLRVMARTRVYFDGAWHDDTPVYRLPDLGSGAEADGPALIINDTFVAVVEPGCRAKITNEGDIRIDVLRGAKLDVGVELDQVQLTIFGHRFMSIAEQMGRKLQRTSVSTNIKERLDFSCALFDASGGLVANAPHLPVHLGAMSDAVRWQIRHLGDSWREGDVIVANHPASGGTHLPDITVITPVFSNGRPVFYVASRGHHADIGGISPGSMPPFSRLLVEEGAAISSFKLVKDGRFQLDGITALLCNPSDAGTARRSTDAPIVGTRNLRDNISDLQAQVSANHKGILLVQELIQQYSERVVLAYMRHIQDNAEAAVREMLATLARKHGLGDKGELRATDYMDDGSCITLSLRIDSVARTATFDFTGTSPQVYSNHNAPRAVTSSAVIYALRCMIRETLELQHEIPLNQGCLNPIKIIIPPASLLDPTPDVGVVAGNVLTSQRITDVVLMAFRAAACSQGCMNNLTFGSATMGYYETIAGGAGAGPSWHGQSGVHTHMTNTRITDPEILEKRYPVMLRQFSLRTGSGGAGLFTGGDGVVRELEFLAPLDFGILSERRSHAPRGLAGGMDAQCGENLLIRARDGVTLNLGGRNAVLCHPGDRVVIKTPGGGGYGTPPASS